MNQEIWINAHSGEAMRVSFVSGGTHRGPQKRLIRCFVRALMRHEVGLFCTLGSPNGYEDLKGFEDALERFRRGPLKGMKWLGCLEQGEEGGRLHWHCILPLQEPWKVKRSFLVEGKWVEKTVLTEEGRRWLEIWRGCIMHPEPHIDGRCLYGSPEKVANYLGKYMAKWKMPGVRCFRSSKNLKKFLVDEGFWEEPSKARRAIFDFLRPEDLNDSSGDMEFTGEGGSAGGISIPALETVQV